MSVVIKNIAFCITLQLVGNNMSISALSVRATSAETRAITPTHASEDQHTAVNGVNDCFEVDRGGFFTLADCKNLMCARKAWSQSESLKVAAGEQLFREAVQNFQRYETNDGRHMMNVLALLDDSFKLTINSRFFNYLPHDVTHDQDEPYAWDYPAHIQEPLGDSRWYRGPVLPFFNILLSEHHKGNTVFFDVKVNPENHRIQKVEIFKVSKRESDAEDGNDLRSRLRRQGRMLMTMYKYLELV